LWAGKLKKDYYKKIVMKKVLVFWTFDIFHEGHRYFLSQAKRQCDLLRVVVARDETVARIKKAKPKNSENSRVLTIKEAQLADEVVLGSLVDKYTVVQEYLPDVICLGYDQEFFINKLKAKLKDFGLEKTKIIRLASFKPE
jgi:cytidyltransferase-like protein